MARVTGQRSSSTLPLADTPRVAGTFPAHGDPADSAQSARSAWRSVTPSIAGTLHVRISRDGGRTYPARYARPLPAGPPGQPATVPVYDAATATGRLLALDLDPVRISSPDAAPRCRPAFEDQAAGLGQLLERVGVRHVADVAPSGGRHVYVLFSSPLPWLELRDVARALALRFPAIDTAPMSSLGGQIAPPGSRHKSGGWRVLSTPVDVALAAIEHPNGPEVWAGLLVALAAELRQAEAPAEGGAVGSTPPSELDDTGVPWVPRLGGRANLSPELARTARTGKWDRTRYADRSAARQAVLTAAAARGWRLAEVQAAIATGAWKGLAGLYGVRPR